MLLFLQTIHSTLQRIVNPLVAAIRREIAAIIARLHRIDFSKPFDPLADMGGGGGPSLYMKDLVEKLGFVKGEILDRYDIGDIRREWSDPAI